MNCKNCGSPLKPTDKFCTACGSGVENASVQPEITEAPEPVVQENNQQPVEPKKEKSNVAVIIVIILILAIAGAILFFVFKGDKDGDKPKEPNNNQQQNNNQNNNQNNQSENTFTLGGFTFTIPEGYSLEIKDGSHFLMNYSNQVSLFLVDVFGYGFDYYKTNVTAVKGVIESEEGVKVSGYDFKTINGKEVLIFKGTITKDGMEITFAEVFGSVSSSKTVQIIFYQYGTTPLENCLNDIVNLILTAKVA